MEKRMTLIIDLSPAEEAWLTGAARQTGLMPDTLAKKLTEHLSPRTNSQAASEEARIAAIWASVGSMAHVGVGVEDLHRERQSDKQKEEAQSTEKA
jgi:hypothetical protein